MVVGDGPYRAKLDARVAQLGLGDKLRFVGQQEDVVPWLQALDLFTLPSYGEEGVPQAIMQAMACAIAVVSTPVGAIREAVRRRCHWHAGRTTVGERPERGSRAFARRSGIAGALFTGRARSCNGIFGIDRMLDGMESVFRHVLKPA